MRDTSFSVFRLWAWPLCALVLFAATALAASLPDWSGEWRVEGSPAVISSENATPFASGTRNHPPLKPEYEAKYRADLVRAQRQGDPKATDVLVDTNTLNCFPGMPRLVATPFNYEFLIAPKETWIIIDKAVRRIFTDGRPWPPEDMRWPMMMGRSKGHWEGDTLVAETITMNPAMWTDPTPLMLSAQATMLERLRKIDANTIEDRVTIHDPVEFTQDWNFVRHYVKQKYDPSDWPDDPELCGGATDRNPIVNGRVTMQLPGDAGK
jgi:hypothetical protein